MTLVLFIFSLISAVVSGVYSLIGLTNRDFPSFISYLIQTVAHILTSIAFFQIHKMKKSVEELEEIPNKIYVLNINFQKEKAKTEKLEENIKRLKREIEELKSSKTEQEGE